jgi:hypothetical protein
MLRVVLPRASLLVEVRLVVVVLVVIVYVLVVDVDVDIAVAPSATPTPAPAATPSGSERDAGPERNRRSRRISTDGRIVNRRIRVSRRAIDYRWVIRGDVNHVGAGLLNHDNLFALDRLGFHFLLCAGF